MLQVFHGIQKCEDSVDSKSTGEKSANNDEQLDDPAANVKQNLLISSYPKKNNRQKLITQVKISIWWIWFYRFFHIIVEKTGV